MAKTVVVDGSTWKILYSYKGVHALIQKRYDGRCYVGIIYNSQSGTSEKWF